MSTKFGGEIIDIDKDINVDILKKKKKYIHIIVYILYTIEKCFKVMTGNLIVFVLHCI